MGCSCGGTRTGAVGAGTGKAGEAGGGGGEGLGCCKARATPGNPASIT